MRIQTLALSFLSCLIFIACKGEASKAPASEATPQAEATQKETDKAPTHEHAAHTDHQAADTKSEAPVKRVFFVSPDNGAKVKNPVKLVFGVEGMGIRKALEDINDKTTGHHHIIVDGGYVEKDQPVPADAKHIHYGGGQTETEITLKPGKHTLTMQLADGAHRSYGKELSATIELEVTE